MNNVCVCCSGNRKVSECQLRTKGLILLCLTWLLVIAKTENVPACCFLGSSGPQDSPLFGICGQPQQLHLRPELLGGEGYALVERGDLPDVL